jgi:enediyne biosynthesis protein E5
VKVIYPSRKDPRLYMSASLCLFVALSQLYLGFSQTRDQIIIAVVSCCLFDVLLTAANLHALLVPLSGLISGLSLCLLLDSGTRLLPFVLAGMLAISSKYVVKFRGKHFFNPTNFALALILMARLGSITPGYQWGGGTTALWIALSMGGMILYRVKRMPLLFSFIVFFIVSAAVRAALGRESLVLAFGLMTGAPFQLFTFFMLPDPRSTPNNPGTQVAFSAAVVLIDFILRTMRVPNTLFLSLFIVDALVLLTALLGWSFDVYTWNSSSVEVAPIKALGDAASPGGRGQPAQTKL